MEVECNYGPKVCTAQTVPFCKTFLNIKLQGALENWWHSRSVGSGVAAGFDFAVGLEITGQSRVPLLVANSDKFTTNRLFIQFCSGLLKRPPGPGPSSDSWRRMRSGIHVGFHDLDWLWLLDHWHVIGLLQRARPTDHSFIFCFFIQLQKPAQARLDRSNLKLNPWTVAYLKLNISNKSFLRVAPVESGYSIELLRAYSESF